MQKLFTISLTKILATILSGQNGHNFLDQKCGHRYGQSSLLCPSTISEYSWSIGYQYKPEKINQFNLSNSAVSSSENLRIRNRNSSQCNGFLSHNFQRNEFLALDNSLPGNLKTQKSLDAIIK